MRTPSLIVSYISVAAQSDGGPTSAGPGRSAQSDEKAAHEVHSVSRLYDRRVDPRPVGVFDSGVGGLTVLHECLVTMPHEDFVYLGDHARLPYGPRPLDEVRRFAREIGAYSRARASSSSSTRATPRRPRRCPSCRRISMFPSSA